MAQASPPSHFKLHFGLAHAPGLHLHVHDGALHLLWQSSAHCEVHFGGAQSVLQPGHPPCLHVVVGHTIAHFGASHFCRHVAKMTVLQAVSHTGGAQTGSQTSLHAAVPHSHLHWGWQDLSSATKAAAGSACVGCRCPVEGNQSAGCKPVEGNIESSAGALSVVTPWLLTKRVSFFAVGMAASTCAC